LILDRIERSP